MARTEHLCKATGDWLLFTERTATECGCKYLSCLECQTHIVMRTDEPCEYEKENLTKPEEASNEQ